MKQPRLARLLQLLALLQSSRGHNAAALAEACGVSRRTLFRDLDVLRQAGLPVRFSEQWQRYHLDGPVLLPPTNFTAEEALALLVLCYELGESLPFCGAAAQAAMKLESSLPGRLRDELRDSTAALRITAAPANRLAGSESIYGQLLQAIVERRCVRIRYDSLTEWEEIGTRLSPYRLLFSRRAWYVIGRSSLHRAVRTFNLGRIRRLEELRERFRPPRGFSIERYLRNAWHLIPEPGPDRRVHLRFQPLVARNVAEVVWHKTQKCKLNPDGTLDFRVTVSGLWEISWWIAGYADQVEVLQPKKLREMVAERARRMVQMYDGP